MIDACIELRKWARATGIDPEDITLSVAVEGARVEHVMRAVANSCAVLNFDHMPPHGTITKIMGVNLKFIEAKP